MKQKILAIIPARGGSKGIPRKNVANLAGRPMIAYTIEAALRAQYIDRVIVSTEDPEIENISLTLGAEVVKRPLRLATDETKTIDVLTQVTEFTSSNGYSSDSVITLQPTSPLRTTKHINEAVELFLTDPNADSLVSCIKVPHIYHPYSQMRLSPEGYLLNFLPNPEPSRRQDKIPTFARNGAAIYITRSDRLQDYIFGGRLIPYFMNTQDSLDIDEPKDLEEAERILGARL